MPDRPGVEEQTVTEEEIAVLGEIAEGEEEAMGELLDELSGGVAEEAPMGDPDLVRICGCGHSLLSHPEGEDCMVADCECEGFETAPAAPRERAAEVYRYEAPQQLMIPTMTADAKVGLITSQVQQVERLVAIMLEVLGVRKDDGTAPYDLWNKALEPAEDAQVLLQGVVKLLKTRNRNRY